LQRERTMPLDAQAIGRGCAGRSRRRTSSAARSSSGSSKPADGAPVTVACTQEAPLFKEVAENFPQAQLTFVNIRETGGWSNGRRRVRSESRALIAAAGRRDAADFAGDAREHRRRADLWPRRVAVEAAQRLADRLDITVLLTKPGDVTPRRTNEFPVLKGTISHARGYLGRLSLRSTTTRCHHRPRAPSSCRTFARRRNLDLRSDPRSLRRHPAIPAHELRPGYLRRSARPGRRRTRDRRCGRSVGPSTAALVHFEEALCAHSRSGITGCTRCLDRVRPPRSRRTAMRSSSTKTSVRAAVRVHLYVRPARRPIRCPARTR